MGEESLCVCLVYFPVKFDKKRIQKLTQDNLIFYWPKNDNQVLLLLRQDKTMVTDGWDARFFHVKGDRILCLKFMWNILLFVVPQFLVEYSRYTPFLHAT